jgi:imidazole glycerol phosphate synthase subunit HisF
LGKGKLSNAEQEKSFLPLWTTTVPNKALPTMHLARLSTEVNIPIIASGGAGTVPHFIDTFTKGKADAALAASVFHFGEISIPELKKQLNQQQLAVRIDEL